MACTSGSTRKVMRTGWGARAVVAAATRAAAAAARAAKLSLSRRSCWGSEAASESDRTTLVVVPAGQNTVIVG